MGAQDKLNELRTLKKSYSDLTDSVANGAKESTLLAESAAIKQAIAEAKPEVDLSGVAQQGDNTEATNTAIYELLNSQVRKAYSVRFEKNDDNTNTYTMVLPLVAGIEGTTIIL